MSRVLLALVIAGVAGCSAAPAVVPLTPSYPTKDAAVQAVLDAVRARDAAALAQQVVNEQEFLKHVWPALPAGQPEVGMPGERAWADHAQRNAGFRAQLLADHGGRRYELVSASFDGSATNYGAFTIHPHTRLDIRDESGVREVRLFGSMIESGGRWKIYSFVVD